MLIKRYGDDWRSHTAEMGSINGYQGSYGDAEYIPHVLRYYHGTKSAGSGLNSVLSAGNGEGDKKYSKTKSPNTINTNSTSKVQKGAGNGPSKSLNNKNASAGNGPITKIANKLKSNKVNAKVSSTNTKSINAFDASKYSLTNQQNFTNKVNDFVTAKDLANSDTNIGSNKIDQIIALLSKISDNTEDTAINTKEIANKDFTAVVDNTNNNNQTQNKANTTNSSSSKGGKSLNDISNSKGSKPITDAYKRALDISRGILQ